MKKSIQVVILLTVLAMVCFPLGDFSVEKAGAYSTYSGYGFSSKKGDINGDGLITDSDRPLLVSCISKPYSCQDSSAADMNNDAYVTSQDLTIFDQLIYAQKKMKDKFSMFKGLINTLLASVENLLGVKDAYAQTCFELDTRGDANGDGHLDLADAVSILGHAFLGKPANCEFNANVNADEQIDIADAIWLLRYLYYGGTPPLPVEFTPGEYLYDVVTLEDLDSSGVYSDSWAYDVNDAGQVVGASKNAAGKKRAVLWNNSPTPVDLGTLGGEESGANGINNNGKVVGWSTTPESEQEDGNKERAFLKEIGSASIVELYNENGYASAYSINDQNLVAGFAIASNGIGHAALWRDLVLEFIPPIPDEWILKLDIAEEINDNSETAGWQFFTGDGGSRPFRAIFWEANKTEHILPLHAACTSEIMAYNFAHGLNDNGIIIGECNITQPGAATLPIYWKKSSGFEVTAMLYQTDTGLRDFQGIPWDINSNNDVVGYIGDKSDSTHDWDAFLYNIDQKKLINLNDVIDPRLGWDLKSGSSINENGVIVGWGTVLGEPKAFKLIPK